MSNVANTKKVEINITRSLTPAKAERVVKLLMAEGVSAEIEREQEPYLYEREYDKVNAAFSKIEDWGSFGDYFAESQKEAERDVKRMNADWKKGVNLMDKLRDAIDALDDAVRANVKAKKDGE